MGTRGCTMHEQKLSACIIRGKAPPCRFSLAVLGELGTETKNRLRQVRQESRAGEEVEGSVS